MAGDLASFIDEVSKGALLRVEDDFGNGFVRLRVSEAQRRQAKQDIRSVEDAVIELLRNARDAGAHAVFVATARSGSERKVVVVDDGDGIPVDMRERIFDPRVTSKLDSFRDDDWGVHGRGMALYSIRENAIFAHVAASIPGGGTSIAVSFCTDDVSERKDQSTLPTLEGRAGGQWEIGVGPRNIARTVAEFALASRETCTVYLGSPLEIAATLRAFGRSFSETEEGRSLDARESAPALRLGLCDDAPSFAQTAAELGLDLSTRSAYRVLQGAVSPVKPLLAIMRDRSNVDEGSTAFAECARRDFRGLKIAEDDIADFSRDLKSAWRGLAEAYYLESDIEPVVKVSRDGVRVTFPVFKQL